MKEYHLERINDNVRNLGLIFILPLFLGGIALVNFWNHPFLGKFGLIVTGFSLLVIIFCYLNSCQKFVLKIDSGNLIVKKIRRKKEHITLIEDIAVIQYNKSRNGISTLTTKKPPYENIIISAKTGKTVFVGNNSSEDFKKFFNYIRILIHAKEVSAYSKQIKMTHLQQLLYINPRYENSPVVKKKMRQTKFYYPLIVFILTIVILILILNFSNIPEIISDFLMKYNRVE